MLDTLTSADWMPLLHQTLLLQIEPDVAPHSFELLEVTELGKAGTDRRRPFSLVFLDRAGDYLPQRIYTLEHPQLGQLAIFLVPIGRDAAGTRYEAIFN